MSELCDLSAVTLRVMIGRREISPVELLDSCIARIEKVNPVLNAMVVLCLDAARERARQAEAEVMRGDALGPLHGLPTAVKEGEDVAGLPSTRGSLLYKDHVASADVGMVARLRAAGAVIIGKTNVPELLNGLTTDNPVYGLTRNAHALDRTCAGSSGGSGVALTTGMVPLATGSDMGGSIRLPAAVSGIAGIRPTPCLVPAERRALGWNLLSVLGPMARDSADTRLFLTGMMGHDPADPLSGPIAAELRGAPAPLDLSSLRVAVTPDLGVVEVTEANRKTFTDKIGAISTVFAECAWAEPDLGGIWEAYYALRASVQMNRYAAEIAAGQTDALTPAARIDIRRGQAMGAEALTAAMAAHTALYRRFQAFFADYDLLITPGRGQPFFTLDEVTAGHERIAETARGGDANATAGRGNITAPVSMMASPAAVIPVGLDVEGLPFGLQVVGPRGADDFVLRACAALEAHCAPRPGLARPIPDLDAIAATPIAGAA